MALGFPVALMLALTALPPGVSVEQDRRCADDLTGAGEAFGAKDYAAGEVFMERAMRSCAAVDPRPEEVASRLETLADFQLRQSKWALGLKTIARCLEADKANPTCHFYKWFALGQHGHALEAAVQRPIAERKMEEFLRRKPAPKATPFEIKRLESRQVAVAELLGLLEKASP